MKTKRIALSALATLIMGTPFFGATAGTATIKPHKVVLQNLTFDSIDATAKTITAHSATNISYTIIYSSKTKFIRASGEKFKPSGFLELLPNYDSITVWGTTTDGLSISASKVRNNSTRKIRGKFTTTVAVVFPIPAGMPVPAGIIGEIFAVKSSNQYQEILVYGNTKLKFGKRKITFAELQAGDVVYIQGIAKTIGQETAIFNTTQIQVKSHGAPPANFSPTSFKSNL